MTSESSLHALLSAEGAHDHPSASLRERVLQRVAAEDDGVSDVRWRPGRFALVSAALTGVLLVGGLVVLLLMSGTAGRKPPAPFAAELAAKHLLYSRGPGELLELTTSDANRMTAWLESRLGSLQPLPRLPGDNVRLLGGRVSSVEDFPAAYILYEVEGRRISLFITQLLPGIRLGAKEKHIRGVELYASVVNGVTVAWWEDEEAGRVYAAVSTERAGQVLDFVLLCAKSPRVSWVPPSRSVTHPPSRNICCGGRDDDTAWSVTQHGLTSLLGRDRPPVVATLLAALVSSRVFKRPGCYVDLSDER
jgi:anti-sigma factor RsiW